ncbi:hypothetical protein BJP44_02595 [Candidatus Williamhamiltonella defendens]|uniref:Alpha-related fimbriae major subunit n=2 Tax=Candidatus Williamhamiltonella defendens TaxID=138072 RepID=C4K416_HAMD5|nr:hypothetical protein HDEF_0562 [Candidatus Hamiltonella defensa 5AT (Acyrthosiphon pisum)]ATW22054.1 hypothetical protein BJP44_02595 [Candidatus Hamiltonella defensa]
MRVKMKIKKLFWLGLIFSSITQAQEDFSFFPLSQHYSSCQMRLLADQSIQISFSVNFKKNLFDLKNIDTHRFMKISPSKLSLYLFFYHLDGSPDHHINLSGIQNISFNGMTEFYITPYINNMYQVILKKNPEFSSEQYHVQLTLLPNTLKRLSVGIAIGAILKDSHQKKWHLIDHQGISFGASGQSCEPFYPKNPQVPVPLKIDPKFKLSSTLWKLKKVNLDKLREKTDSGTGLKAEFMNTTQNKFCVNYVSLGTVARKYRVSARNQNGLDITGQFFQLKEEKENQLIHYKMDFYHEGPTKNDFSLPNGHQQIHLKKNDENPITQMCWAPDITLFSSESTDQGNYSDVLHFVITPYLEE